MGKGELSNCLATLILWATDQVMSCMVSWIKEMHLATFCQSTAYENDRWSITACQIDPSSVESLCLGRGSCYGIGIVRLVLDRRKDGQTGGRTDTVFLC